MLSLFLALALTAVDVDVVHTFFDKAVSVNLMPNGKAELKREGTLTRVRVEVERLLAPSSLGAAFSTYLVWAVSPEGIVENLGELNIQGNKAQINATTRFGQLGILVTAEPHYMVDLPSPAVAYRSSGPREEVRHYAVPVDVGAYDYSGIQAVVSPGAHVSVTQARIAVQIAQNAGADRFAEPELRRARVALASMEELLARAAPVDILWPAAGEAIRWSQRAVTMARTQNAQRELTELRQRQEELQKHLSLTFRNEHFDANGLTDAGRDALLRISSIAGVAPGPVRLEGNAPDIAVKAATEFLILAGVPQDRIITRR